MTVANRQRKTKAPCEGCGLHRDRCVCALIPSLDLRTRLCLVVHAKELKRTTNTGRLAVKALVNSEMRIRGDSTETLDLSDLVSENHRALLFFPTEDAVELDQDFVRMDPRPVVLIVPDGNWRQASKVHHRHHELKNIPRVKISSPNISEHHLRAETTPEGMATLEAIAKAFGVLEGPAVEEKLMALYRAKLANTLIGRGVKLPSR
jgi:DTW domain-containing protein YfiP